MTSAALGAGLVVDREDQVRLAQRQRDAIGAGKAVDQLERVALQQIEHGDLALVLDLAAPAHDARGIEADVADPRAGRARSCRVGGAEAHARRRARGRPAPRPAPARPRPGRARRGSPPVQASSVVRFRKS